MKKLLGMGIVGMLALGACAPANTADTTSDSIVANTTPTTPDTAPPDSTDTTAAATTTTTAPATTTTTATAAPAATTGDPSGNYQVTQQPTAPANVTPVGTVRVSQTPDGNTKSDVSLTNLMPGTFYVAHYHLQGTAGTDPCASGGDPILSSKIVGQTDTQGALTMSGTVPTANIANATYFNIHTATGPDGATADPGVACTPLRRQ